MISTLIQLVYSKFNQQQARTVIHTYRWFIQIVSFQVILIVIQISHFNPGLGVYEVIAHTFLFIRTEGPSSEFEVFEVSQSFQSAAYISSILSTL